MTLWRVTRLLVVLLCAVAAVACARHHDTLVLVRNECYTLNGDTLSEQGVVVTAATPHHIESTLTRERLDSLMAAYGRQSGYPGVAPAMVGGKPWRWAGAHDGYPAYSSPHHLLEAVYNMSVDHVVEASVGPTYDARGDTVALYGAMALSLAWLDPERTQRTLRGLVTDGRVAPLGGWPMSATHLAWAVAAWNVYTATGDKQWLTWVHDVLVATLEADATLLTDRSCMLLRGATDARAQGFYPAWMGLGDVAQSMPMYANVLACQALGVLEDADEALGLEHDHHSNNQRLKDAINQHLWNERQGCYAAYLYGAVTPVQAPIADNLAQALAVLTDVADDDRAATLIEHTPIGSKGLTLTYPANDSIEPYFTHCAWPVMQALWALAAARQDNEGLMLRSMGALVRAQALYQSRHIIWQPQGTNDLVTSASSLAVTLRVLAGISYADMGIELRPMVPECLDGGFEIKGLHYRKATIDFTFTGIGNEVERLEVDGTPCEGSFVPDPGEGHHSVRVWLRQLGTSGTVTLANTSHSQPLAPLISVGADSATIVDYQEDTKYYLVVDGRMASRLTQSTFALPEPTSGVSMLSVAVARNSQMSFMARPIMLCGGDSYTITIDITQGDTIAVDIAAARGGQHLLQLDYGNTGWQCDALLVSANSHYQGTLLLPPAIAADGTDSVAASTIIAIDLLRGNNHLVLTRPTLVTPQARPVRMRVIRR